MNHDPCDNLDRFLTDELSVDATARFTEHVADCDACRDAVDQQRWIDSLLTSPVCLEIEVVPALVWSLRATVSQRRRTMRYVAIGLAAAAAIVLALGWNVLNHGDGNLNVAPMVAAGNRDEGNSSRHLQNGNEQPPKPPQATFVGGPDVLVVPLESKHPNVTVVRVYPVYQPVYTAQVDADLLDATDQFAWPDDLDGG